jgi:hypothetical protein
MLRTLLPRYGRLQERSLIWAVLAESSNPYLAPGEINQLPLQACHSRADVCSGPHKPRELRALSSVFATVQSWLKPCHFPIDCGKQQEEKGHGKF